MGLSPSIPAMLIEWIALGWFCVFGHGTGTDRASLPDGRSSDGGRAVALRPVGHTPRAISARMLCPSGFLALETSAALRASSSVG